MKHAKYDNFCNKQLWKWIIELSFQAKSLSDLVYFIVCQNSKPLGFCDTFFEQQPIFLILNVTLLDIFNKVHY